MADIMGQVWWLLTRLGRDCGRNAQYYIAHPREAWEELIDYARENPWKFAFSCIGIGFGIATIVLPLAIGFGPAGPILGSIAAGWQSSIGSVVAGSAFAIIQSMAMTGVFAAIGGTLIGVGAAIPLLGRLGSWIGSWFGSGTRSPGALMASLDPETLHLLTAGASPDALLRRRGMKPRPGWFLEPRHSPVTDAVRSNREGATKRTLVTNSKETWDFVWDGMDVWADGTVAEHALERFRVRIVLLRPKRARGEEGFREAFTAHETDCHPDCWCVPVGHTDDD